MPDNPQLFHHDFGEEKVTEKVTAHHDLLIEEDLRSERRQLEFINGGGRKILEKEEPIIPEMLLT